MQHPSDAMLASGNTVLERASGPVQTTVHLWPLSMAAGIMRFWVKRVQAYAEQFEELAMRRNMRALGPDGMNHALLAKSEPSETFPVIEPGHQTARKVPAARSARPKRAPAKAKKAAAKRTAAGAKRKAATAQRNAVGAKPVKKARRG